MANISTDEFNERYIDKQDVLQKFSISSRTLQTWRSDRLITHFRIGNKSYYLKEDIARLIANKTIPGKINNESAIDLNPEISILTESNEPDEVLKVNSPSSPTKDEQQKSFSGLWNPIPPYVVPLLVVLIYLSPFAVDIVKGEPITPYLLVLPIILAGVGYAVYWLVRLCVWIFRKLTSWRKETVK